MEESEILRAVVDTLTGKRIFKITIPIKWNPKPSLNQRIQNLLKGTQTETHRTFDIWPCIVSNQYRIAGNAALLIDGLFERHSDNIQFICDNQPIVVYVVAAAIQNNHLEPDPALIEFIEKNFDGEDLYITLKAAFSNMGMQSFSNSIDLLKGTVKILQPEEASPSDGRE
jgi:hypothetical protein